MRELSNRLKASPKRPKCCLIQTKLLFGSTMKILSLSFEFLSKKNSLSFAQINNLNIWKTPSRLTIFAHNVKRYSRIYWWKVISFLTKPFEDRKSFSSKKMLITILGEIYYLEWPIWPSGETRIQGSFLSHKIRSFEGRLKNGFICMKRVWR